MHELDESLFLSNVSLTSIVHWFLVSFDKTSAICEYFFNDLIRKYCRKQKNAEQK